MNAKKIFSTSLLSLLSVILLSLFTGCNVIKNDLLLPQLMVLRKALASIGSADNSIYAPSFSPAAGTYSAVQSVTISTTTTGAILCYTTDGSTPSCDSTPTCANGNLYSSPVSIATTTTLKALTCKAGNQYSAVGTGSYTLNGAVDIPVISNLRDKGIVNTGFMIGTAGSNTSSVEVSLDNGSYSPATGTTSWKFQFPIGSSTWRDNSQHTISVRTKNSLGNTSSVVSITVRKGVNRDVNGDGYPDLAVGSPIYNTNQGRVYIFHSSMNGITASIASSAQKIITGIVSTYFGCAVVLGDINGDGYADLAVGADLYNTNQGEVFIFHSSGSNGITVTNATSANSIITGESINNNFGEWLAIGNTTGSGYADLLVGAPIYNANQGRAYIFRSTGSNGIPSNSASTADTILTGEAAGNVFGNAVAIGDSNGDGYSDVAVGGTSYNTSQGRAYVFHSSASGITSMNASSANSIITGETTTNYFGVPCFGDINGDGFQDLVVTANAWNTNQGRVYIVHSNGVSGIPSINASASNTIITGQVANNYLGRGITTGDINGDGFSDVGIQGELVAGTSMKGYILLSSGSSGISSMNASSANTIITGLGGASNNFFQHITFLDINGDGFQDAVYGTHYELTNTGIVRIFHSLGTSGIPSMAATSANSIISGEATGHYFGAAISN